MELRGGGNCLLNFALRVYLFLSLLLLLLAFGEDMGTREGEAGERNAVAVMVVVVVAAVKYRIF